jgi:hypothetical protein
VKKLLLATALAFLFVSSGVAQPSFDKSSTPENVNSGRLYDDLIDEVKAEIVNNTPDLQCYLQTYECIAAWSGHVVVITKATFGGSAKIKHILCGVLLGAALASIWLLIMRRIRSKFGRVAINGRSGRPNTQQ